MIAANLHANLWIAYSACLLGMASPGPSNLAIMGVAMNAGRLPALALSVGVLAGSLVWGLLASFGLASVLAAYSSALIIMKLGAAIYLLWLAYKAARSALSTQDPLTAALPTHEAGYVRLFLRGAGMHLTNPKAIFVWLSIVSMGLPAAPKVTDSLAIVAGCASIGMFVFGTYAMVFSTPLARTIYRSLRRWFEAALALLFGYAGIRMLLSERPGL